MAATPEPMAPIRKTAEAIDMAKSPGAKPAAPQPKAARGLKPLRFLLWAAVLSFGLAATWFVLTQSPRERTLADEIGQGDYSLTTTAGTAFTRETLRGEPSLVFFGFTHCPDVCPTTLGDIADWRDLAGVDIRAFLITVDPERDTVESMRDYVGWLPNAQGVTGTPEEIAKAAKDFKIYVSRVPLDGGDYTMNHSNYVMLFDAEGRYRQIFSYQTEPERVAPRLKDVVAGS